VYLAAIAAVLVGAFRAMERRADGADGSLLRRDRADAVRVR
jgi:hypothetical protein